MTTTDKRKLDKILEDASFDQEIVDGIRVTLEEYGNDDKKIFEVIKELEAQGEIKGEVWDLVLDVMSGNPNTPADWRKIPRWRR